jgi:16S rRNA C967 or C1407 C5-methylase (RsmB/RsmF family)
MMENRGKLVAADTNERRMQRGRTRMKRAGAENYHSVTLNGTDDDFFFSEYKVTMPHVWLLQVCPSVSRFGKQVFSLISF